MTSPSGQYQPREYSDANIHKLLQGMPRSHTHSRFTDVGAKGCDFEGWDFSYCVFKRAYFHNATFTNCKFVGAQFINCSFRHASIRSCNFSYARFDQCTIPTAEILNNLPAWPNVRRELLQMLRRNATSMGDYNAEKQFIVKEIDAQKEHLRRAWKQEEPYYKQKYGKKLKRLSAGLRLSALRIDGFVWGHGERPLKAVIPLLLSLALLSAILVIIRSPSLMDTTLSDHLHSFTHAFLYHGDLFLGVPSDSPIEGAKTLDWLVAILRYLAFGILLSAIYRRMAHR